MAQIYSVEQKKSNCRKLNTRWQNTKHSVWLDLLNSFAGIDKLECKIKWNALYPNVLRTCANPFLATMIQVRANLETYNGIGRIKEVPATAFIIGTFKEFPLGNIKPHENAEYETTMTVTYAKLIVDKQEVFEIDVLQNIYKVGMIDMLATFKKNVGA